MIDFIVYTLLSLSLLLNVFSIYYAVLAARKLMIVSSNFEALEEIISSFESHVKVVHESEMFYGDTTLQALMDHSTDLLEQIENYKNLDTLVFYEEEEIVLENENEKETT